MSSVQGVSAAGIPAENISVTHFSQLLMWPLFLRTASAYADLTPSDLAAVTRELARKSWQLAGAGESPTKQQALDWYGGKEHEDFSGIVYFHSLVRHLLCGGTGRVANIHAVSCSLQRLTLPKRMTARALGEMRVQRPKARVVARSNMYDSGE